MKIDELDGLIALKLVGEKLSFTAAAKELGISPSRISQVIKQLETRLGAPLVSRTTRSISLTEAGAQFLSQSGPSLAQILIAIENVGHYAKKPSGLLRLNIPQSFYSSYLGPIVQSFTKKFPEVTVEIFSENAAVDVVEGGFDAGIRLSEILVPDMVAQKILGPVRFAIVASPKYWNKAGRPKHPKDLQSHNCLVSRFGRNSLYNKWDFENKGKEFQVQVKGSLIFNEPTSMRQAIHDGIGVSYGIENFLTEEIRTGKLEIVLQQFAATSPGFYLYYPKRSQVQPKLRAFIEHLKSIK